MKILDLQTGRIHEYGENCHDSLRISEDGRNLTYYNLQNGDGSCYGDYRFVMDDDKIPAESKTADALHGESFFNIGGFEKREEHERQAHWLVRDGYPHKVYCSLCHVTFCDTRWEVWKDGSLPRAYCPNCGAKMS